MLTYQYSKYIKSGLRVLCCFAFLGLMPVTTRALAVSYNPGSLEFSTSGQSMWGSGAATILDKNEFLGAVWNESVTFGGFIGGTTSITIPHPHLPSGFECHGFLCTGGHFHNPGFIHDHVVSIDTTTGVAGTASTSGRVGFNFNAQIDSGSVAALVKFDAQAILPDPGSFGLGDFINLNPNSLLADGQLNTNLAEASAKLEAVLGARASFNGTICVAGDCTTNTLDIGFADQTLPLLSFNDAGSPGQIKILGLADPALFQFDNEINIPSPVPGGSVGGVTIHVPDINATGGISGNKLSASGMDDFITLTADLDGILLAPAGLPGLGVSLDLGIFSGSADLIDVDLGPKIKLVQDFEFTPTLFVDLLFDNPVMVAGMANPVTLLTSAWDELPDFSLLFPETTVTPTFSVQGLFSNDTLLGIDGLFRLDVLKASLSVGFAGASLDIASLGPLFQILETGNLFNTPPLFSQDFALGGFNAIQGPSFNLSIPVPSSSIPEPSSLVLLASGLPMLWWVMRHRTIKR